MKKKMNKKGFTLAELLIVVAIIAVLVAIAIPVFTSQLEKSREATDISNIRSAYAEITTGLLTGDLKEEDNTIIVGSAGTATLTEDLPTGDDDDDEFVVELTPFSFQQGQKGWQTAEFEIAGIKGGEKVAEEDNNVGDWEKDCDMVSYTFKLAEDGDYFLSKIELKKSGDSTP